MIRFILDIIYLIPLEHLANILSQISLALFALVLPIFSFIIHFSRKKDDLIKDKLNLEGRRDDLSISIKEQEIEILHSKKIKESDNLNKLEGLTDVYKEKRDVISELRKNKINQDVLCDQLEKLEEASFLNELKLRRVVSKIQMLGFDSSILFPSFLFLTSLFSSGVLFYSDDKALFFLLISFITLFFGIFRLYRILKIVDGFISNN